MRSHFLLTNCLLAARILTVQADALLWAQCGGQEYTGELICAYPGECVYYNEAYSQCQPTISSFLPQPPFTIQTLTNLPSRSTKPVSATSSRTAIATATRCALPQPAPTDYYPIFASTAGTAASYLQLNQLPLSGAANLDSVGIQAKFEYLASPLGSYLRVKTGYPCPTTWWLSVDELSPHSYKPLIWKEKLFTDYWVVAPGKNITTSKESPFGVVSSFIACGEKFELYLQTGDELPAGRKCSTTTLELVMGR